MVRVYVHSKKECPSDAVLREGPNGGKYYLPEERGKGAEVGGVVETFDDLLTPLTKDDPLDEVVDMVANQVLPEEIVTENFKSRVVSEIRSRIESEQFEKQDVIEVVKDMSEKTEKLQMQRVYVTSEDQVPEPYVPMRDDADQLYYEIVDAPHIDSGRTSKNEDPCWDGYTMVGTKENGDPRCVPDDEVENYDADKTDKSRVYVSDPSEVPEGYDVQEGSGGGLYYETGAQQSSIEDMGEDELEEFREYLMDQHEAAREANDDDLMRDILDTVMDVDDVMYEEGYKSEKALVYVGGPDEVPEGYTPQQGQRGGWYYDTEEDPSRGVMGSISDVAQSVVEGLENIVTGPQEDSPEVTEEQRQQMEELASRLRGRGGGSSGPDFDPTQISPAGSGGGGGELTEEERQRMEEVAGRAMQEQLDLIRADVFGEVVNSLSKSDASQDEIVEALLFLENEFESFDIVTDSVSKSRVYVSDPSEVPDKFEVQEGQQGGYYYETDSGHDITPDEAYDVVEEVEDEVGVDPDAIGDRVFTESDPENMDDGDMRDEFTDDYIQQVQEYIEDEFGEDVYEQVEDAVHDTAAEYADIYAPTLEDYEEQAQEPF